MNGMMWCERNGHWAKLTCAGHGTQNPRVRRQSKNAGVLAGLHDWRVRTPALNLPPGESSFCI
jgi:hypothetical protein